MNDTNKNNPLVSVIIPLFNGEKYIRECLDSVFCQTYRPIEVIVVDDASSDRSLEIVYEYPVEMLVFSQKHGDVAKARNTGIKNSHGEFFALLDQDDLWLQYKVEKQVQIFAEYPDTDLVYTNAEKIYPSGKQHEQKDKTRISRRMEGKDYFPVLARKNLIIPSSVMIKKSVVAEIGLFDESFKTCGDWEYWLRLSGIGKRIRFLDEILMQYRYHGENTCRNTELMHTDRIKVLEKIFGNDLLRNKYAAIESECFARAYYLAANNFYSIGEKDTFFELFEKAWNLDKKSVNVKALRRFIREKLRSHK